MPKIEIPKKLRCPITWEIFKKPVIAKDGYIYEEEAIEKWVAQNGTSPKTRQPLSSEFILDLDKRSQVLNFQEKHNICTKKQFLAAVKKGEVAEFEKLNYLENYLEAATEDGWTPLHWATYNNHFEIVKLLIVNKANLVVTTEDGWTPLHLAAIKGQIDIVMLLLSNNADLETTDKHNWTSLHWATCNNHLEIVQLLLEYGANHKALTKTGRTPAAIAQENNRPDLVKLLTDYPTKVESGLKQTPCAIGHLKTMIQQQPQDLESFTISNEAIIDMVYDFNACAEECLANLQDELIDAQTSHLTVEKKQLLYYLIDKIMHKIFKDKQPNVNAINEFITLWLYSLALFTKDQIREATGKLLILIVSLEEKSKEYHLWVLLENLIINSTYKVNAYTALETLLEKKSIRVFIIENNQVDSLFIDSLNSISLRRQDAYKHFNLYAKTFKQTIGTNRKRLATIFEKINFTLSHELPYALYEIFVGSRSDKLYTAVFFQALTDSLQLNKFQDSSVIRGKEKQTIEFLDQWIGEDVGEVKLVERLVQQEKIHLPEKKFPVHTLLTQAFLFLSQYKVGLSDTFLWYQLLYLLGTNMHEADQNALCLNLKAEIKKHQIPIQLKMLAQSLEDSYRYYHGNYQHESKFLKVYETLVNKLLEAARKSTSKSIELFIEMLCNLIKYSLGINKDWLHDIFSYTGESFGEYKDSLTAVLETFTETMQGENPDLWPIRSLCDRIFFLYCYAKYPITDYYRWFITANPAMKEYAATTLPKTMLDVINLRNTLSGYEQLPQLGFKVLQNSQLVAIKCAISPCNDTKHVFIKVGTGQGKSLIICDIS